MAEKGYGEIKGRAKIFPSDIDKFSEQGVGIALVQAKASPKTKQRAEAKGIKLYDNLSPWKTMLNSGRRRILYWCCVLWCSCFEGC